MTEPDQILARIQNYLGNGGLFNPEMMEHDKVRDLMMDCRDLIDRAYEPADCSSKKITCGDDLRNQLEIKGGRLVMINSGKTPTFDFPDGTHVVLLKRDYAVEIVNNHRMMQVFGA
jgi:hypothetical protein